MEGKVEEIAQKVKQKDKMMESRRKKYKRIRSPIQEIKHLDNRGSGKTEQRNHH